jgi:hypothetical protein
LAAQESPRGGATLADQPVEHIDSEVGVEAGGGTLARASRVNSPAACAASGSVTSHTAPRAPLSAVISVQAAR